MQSNTNNNLINSVDNIKEKNNTNTSLNSQTNKSIIKENEELLQTSTHIKEKLKDQANNQLNNTIKSTNIPSSPFSSTISSLFDFSKEEKNILVIVLDKADGYRIMQRFKDEPEYAQYFEGFTYFENALSSSQYTFQTLTSLIGGENYTVFAINASNPKQPILQTLAFGYANTLNAFAKEGYDVSAYLSYPAQQNNLKPLLQYRTTIVYEYSKESKEFEEFFKKDTNIETTQALPTPQLISLGLFKFAPYSARTKIYRKNKWLFSNNKKDNGSIHYIAPIYTFTRNITNNAIKPTFKFFHFNITHEPHGLNTSCKYMGYYGLGGDVSEKCALKWLDHAFTTMKELGIYDNTEIFILSDHGVNRDVLPVPYEFHVPFFYKPFYSNGSMQRDSRLIANYDIATIFCANLPHGCQNVGENILLQDLSKREILTYASDNKWQGDTKNDRIFSRGLIFKAKSGNIYDKGNWKDITKQYYKDN